jgi:cbb3-type cytochrome oxidase subunit 1
MVALVHLITLGWITFSIFGAMYIVGPLALRMNMPARRMDYVAYALALVGLIGMVAHFWIEKYDGMAWSAATIAVGALYTTGRIVAAVREAKVPPAVKLHVVLACVNFWLATSMGILIAVDKVTPFLPGFILSNVFAHAHLAALGWATMMVVGVGYRLLPMVLPSRMPSGPSMYASAILLETGVLGLFGTLVLRSKWTWIAGLCVCAGLGVFAGHVIWMVRHPA